MYGYIYKTTNLINGKIYVGQHKSNEYDSSYYGSGKILKLAIEKYGLDNFSNTVLCWCESKKELDKLERQLIKQYDSRNPNKGYNIAFGGEGGDLVTCLSNEDYLIFCNHMSDLNKLGIIGNKGKQLSEEHRQKIGNGNRGKKHSEEWINKQRQKVIGNTPWNKGLTIEDDRVKKYARKKGQFNHTEETKIKISNSKKGISPNIKNIEARNKKISDKLKGKPKSEEHTEKCRKVAVGRIWVHNDLVSKMIYPNELEQYINNGYKKGRLKWLNRV